PAWLSDAGVAWQLESTGGLLRRSGESYFQLRGGLPYSLSTIPSGETAFTLVSPTGRRHEWSRQPSPNSELGFGLRRIVQNDVALRVTNSEIVAADGTRARLVRDASGRIHEVVTPDGRQVFYQYDSAGLLVSVVGPEADAPGRGPIFYGYDESGRLESISDSAGGTAFVRDASGVIVDQPDVLAHLGGIGNLAGNPVAGNRSGAADRYSLTLTQPETQAAPGETVQIAIVVQSNAFDPAPAMIDGTSGSTSTTETGRSVTLFSIDRAGTHTVQIDGDGDGAYQVEIRIVGDIDADDDVDADDASALAAALGTMVGDAAYTFAADFDGDGQIDALDQAALQSMFGFSANAAPELLGDLNLPSLIAGRPNVVSLAAWIADPDGDPVWSTIDADRIPNALSVEALGGHLYAITPDEGGANSQETLAWNFGDTLLQSGAEFSFEIISSNPTKFEFEQLSFALNVGEQDQISIAGFDADAQAIDVLPSAFEYATSDPNVAIVTDTGQVIARGVGTAIVSASLDGKRATGLVNVETFDDRTLEFFPLSYLVETGQTRQFDVRHFDGFEAINDLTAAADGSTYWVHDPSVATISADGLLTPVAAGTTDVTVINGGQIRRVPISVRDPDLGVATVDASGAAVSNAEGMVLSVGPGTLPEGTEISIDAHTGDLPLPLPLGFESSGAFTIDLGGQNVSHPASIAVANNDNVPVGTDGYLFQLVDIINDAGELEPSWLLMDHTVVGDDGMIRTASAGFAGTGVDLPDGVVARPAVEGLMVTASPNLLTLSFAQGQMVERALTKVTDSSGRSYHVVPGLFADFLIPTVPQQSYEVIGLQYNSDGTRTASNAVQFTATAEPQEIGLLVLPTPPAALGIDAPVITAANVVTDPVEGPSLKIRGNSLLAKKSRLGVSDTVGQRPEDIRVQLIIGGKDRQDEDGNPIIVGSADLLLTPSEIIEDSADDDFELTVRIAQTFAIGDAEIRVERMMNRRSAGELVSAPVRSNPVRVVGGLAAQYGFAAIAARDEITVIDVKRNQEIANAADGQEWTQSLIEGLEDLLEIEIPSPDDPRLLPGPAEVARIPIQGVDPGASPRGVVLSADQSIGYVPLERAAAVAVIDAIALQQVDVIADRPNEPGQSDADNPTLGINVIDLPSGATPFWAVSDRSGQRLFVSDRNLPAVYVINIDATSTRYNQHVRTLNIDPSLAPLGTRGLETTFDGKHLHVAAPARELFRFGNDGPGHILTFDLTTISEDASGDITGGTYAETLVAVTEVGPSPMHITANTDDPDFAYVTDLVSDSNGVTVLERIVVPDRTGGLLVDRIEIDPTPISLLEIGGNRSRNRQAFGLTNAVGVTYVAQNAFARRDEANASSELRDQHPAYLVLSTFNQFVQSDPKHDPTLPYSIASDGQVTQTYLTNSGSTLQRPRPFPVTAGSNLGFVRLPGKNFSGPSNEVVAATRGVPGAFADNVAWTPFGGMVYSPYTARRGVFGFSLAQAVKLIEQGTRDTPGFFNAAGQVRLDPISQGTSTLKNVPIDDVFPFLNLASDFRFYAPQFDPDSVSTSTPAFGQGDQFDEQGRPFDLVFGVPEIDLLARNVGAANNPFAPIATGAQVRGLSIQQPIRTGYQPEDNEYNQRVNLCETGAATCSRAEPIGVSAKAELHSGAVQNEHGVAAYRSGGVDRGLVLKYDSLRADPRPILHYKFNDVELPSQDSVVIARLSATLNGETIKAPGVELTAELSDQGFVGGENFFTVDQGGDFGAALQLDMTDAESGVYDYIFEAGVYSRNADGTFTGEMGSFVGQIPLINGRQGLFGAGWGIADYFRIYDLGGQAALVVNGNGNESIRSINAAGDPLSGNTGDRSKIIRELDGSYTMGSPDGTLIRFDADGLMQSSVDMFGNRTRYSHAGDRLKQIIDPYGKSFTLTYAGDRVSKITDPAGRETQFVYGGSGFLIAIVDPDQSRRQFVYDKEGRMTAETHKRGNAFPGVTESLADDFTETFTYDKFGRFESSERLDGRNIEMEPAQVVGLYGSTLTSSPDNIAAGVVNLDPIRVRYRDASGEDRFTRVDVFGMYLEASANAGSTRPSPATTKVVRDAENRVQSEQFFDESLNQETATTYFYDDNGELEKIVEFDGSTSSFESKSVPHPVDSRFNYVYQSKYTAPDGTVTDYTFTNNGRNRETKLTV
ncbi:MAG: Ig-like domain-containing protein, partial [Planctomycetota bacterium]